MDYRFKGKRIEVNPVKRDRLVDYAYEKVGFIPLFA